MFFQEFSDVCDSICRADQTSLAERRARAQTKDSPPPRRKEKSEERKKDKKKKKKSSSKADNCAEALRPPEEANNKPSADDCAKQKPTKRVSFQDNPVEIIPDLEPSQTRTDCPVSTDQGPETTKPPPSPRPLRLRRPRSDETDTTDEEDLRSISPAETADRRQRGKDLIVQIEELLADMSESEANPAAAADAAATEGDVEKPKKSQKPSEPPVTFRDFQVSSGLLV
jgi:hypothetical protein